MSHSNVMAEQFVVELEERAKNRAVLTAEARQVLVRELSIRLEASHNAKALLLRWHRNEEQYVRRALGPPRARVMRAQIQEQAVLRQLSACSEACPVPENPRTRANPESGSQDVEG